MINDRAKCKFTRIIRDNYLRFFLPYGNIFRANYVIFLINFVTSLLKRFADNSAWLVRISKKQSTHLDRLFIPHP